METHTKWRQEYEFSSGSKIGMEDQLQWLINAIVDSSMAATTVIRKSNHEEFGAVRSRLESIFNIVSKQPSARPLLQDILSISIEPQVWNVQVPSTAIDVGNVEGSQQLHPVQSLTLDLNKISTTELVELQHGATLELVTQQQALMVGYIEAQDFAEQLKKDVTELHQVCV